MAEEAVFPIKFPTDNSGIDRGISALDRLRKAIQDDKKELQALQQTMQSLKLDPNVQAFQRGQEGLKKAQAEADKLQAKLQALQAKSATASPKDFAKIEAEISATTAEYDKQVAAVGRQKKALAELEKNPAVKQFKDLGVVMKATEQRIADNTQAFTRAGGDLTKLGEAVKAPKQGLEAFGDGANAAGSGLGGLVGKFQQLKALGPAALLVAAVLAVVAITTAIVRATYEFGRFVVTAADAARSAGILREAAAGSNAGARALDVSISRVRAQVAGTREEFEGLALELRRNGLEGAALERTLRLTTMTAKVMGDAAASKLRGFVEAGLMTKRLVLNPFDLRGTGIAFNDVARQLAKQMGIAMGAARVALQNGQVKLEDGIRALDAAVKMRFGDLAKGQLVALPNQLARLRENVAGIFKDVDPTAFLVGLHEVLGLLDETTETGRTLRALAKTVFQPLLDGAAKVFPFVRVFILGMVDTLLDLAIVGLQAWISLKHAFGDSALFKNVDGLKIAFFAGKVAVAGFIVGIVLLTAALAPLAVMGLLVASPFILLGLAIFGVAAAVTFAAQAIEEGVDKALATFGLAVPKAKKMGNNLVAGLISGVKEKAPDLGSALASLAPAGLQSFNDAAKIHSPSRLFKPSGGHIVGGIEEGVDDAAPRLGQSIASLADPAPLDKAAAARGGASGTRGGITIQQLGPFNIGGAAGGRPMKQELTEVLTEVLEEVGRNLGLGPVVVESIT